MERHRALDALSRLRVEEDELLQLFDALDARSRMFEGLAPGDEHGARAGILQNVAHLIDGLRRVDGNVDRVPFGVTANSVETEPRYSVERGRVFATDHGVVAHCYRCHVYSFSLISEIRGETATELRLERYRGTT